MKDQTNLEKITGSLPVTGSATVAAALTGGPIAALLPVLLSTLANSRHKERVEAALNDLEHELIELGEKVQNITDAQYKFINESIITMLHSPDDEKIEFLKKAIKRSAYKDRLNLHEAGLISRILRDITVEELTLLIECHGKKVVFTDQAYDDCLNINKLSPNGERATGLIGLGLLIKEAPDGLWDDRGLYVFTLTSNKLLELLN